MHAGAPRPGECFPPYPKTQMRNLWFLIVFTKKPIKKYLKFPGGFANKNPHVKPYWAGESFEQGGKRERICPSFLRTASSGGPARMAVPGASTRRSELKSKTATAYRDLIGLPARERRLQRKTYHARYQNMERGDGPRHSWPALPAPARVRPNYRISGRRSGFPRDTRLDPPDRGGGA